MRAGHILALLPRQVFHPSCSYHSNKKDEEVRSMREIKHSLPTPDTVPVLNQLERTMLASIALMKRIRRERRRSSRSESAQDENQ